MFSAPLETIEPGIFSVADFHRPKVPIAQASNFFSLTTTLYEPLWRQRSLSMITLGAFSVTRELELMLEGINPQPNQTILDAACSAGLYARTILQHVKNQATVHALDFSLPFLRKARHYAQRDRVSLFLIQADVNKLPYQNRVFDTIVCGGSLNEFINIPQAVAEFSRVLKPGGLMWQMYIRRAEEPIGTTLQGLLRLSGIRFIDPKTFEKHCNHNGLQLLKTQYRGRIVMALFEKSKS